jgi:hypothetical protein
MDKYLINPKKNKKSVKIKDFSPYTSLSVNFSTSNGLEHCLGYTQTNFGITEKVIKGYYLENSFFLYCADNCLYQNEGGMFVKKIESKNFTPLLCSIKSNGKNVVMALCDGVGYLLGDTVTQIDTPKANSICEYKGRIFIANDNLVYYGDAFDYDNFANVIGGYGYFSFDNRDGAVVKIITYDDYVLVFCQKALYKIYTSATGEFLTKRLNTFSIKIALDTIAIVGNEVFFISHGKLVAYKNEALRVIDSLENYKIANASGAVDSFNYYTLSITNSDGQKKLFFYDTHANTSFLIENDELVMIGNGYAFDNESFKIVELSEKGQVGLKSIWKSKKIDFLVGKHKNLTSIVLFVEGKGSLRVKGDFGQREFSLDKEYVNIYPNLYSKYFILEIKSDEMDFSVKNLQLEYNL